jgi:Uma2 family endonuclease
MSPLSRSADFVSPDEYLVRERAAECRSEYLNGVIVAMAGGTFAHDLICGNVQRHLGNQLAARPCYVFSSDMKVRIARANLFRYPDVSAVCGPVLFHDHLQDAYENPSLIVEVLSPTTERYDRTEKFALYRFLDSLTEYLLIAQDRCHAQLFRNQPGGSWTEQTYTSPESLIVLESIGYTLELGQLYEKVPLHGA